MRDQVHRTVEAAWRMESTRLIAGLARMTGDLGLAEELAQEALVAALENWPGNGIPDNPGAWLMAAAKFRAIDHFRRNRRISAKNEQLEHEIELQRLPDGEQEDATLDDPVGDDMLRLIFVACHPVLSMDARVALTLKLLCGLGADEIARAFLVPEATVAQRIVRAKRVLRETHVRFEVPRGAELARRLDAVLEVIYLVFNEGYTATSGEDWMRPALCEEALRLGRILAELVPREPEVHGLVALMEIQSSRLRARVSSAGEPVLLLQQDRGRWDQMLIRRGLAALNRAATTGRMPGPYLLQAEVAACHARARAAEETDWIRITALYDALAQVAPSPIVELNRAVAVAMAYGPAAALELVEPLATVKALRRYHLLPSVRGDLLHKLGRLEEAQNDFKRAATLTRNARERAMLLQRAAQCEQDMKLAVAARHERKGATT